MNLDENDILSTNVFIREPAWEDLPRHKNDEFADYYKGRAQPTTVDAHQTASPEAPKIRRVHKERKTIVSIDSRDRDKSVYPKPSHFKIALGKSFYNVKSMRLAALEFPNTDAVINSTNNKIYWRNKEDIENDIIDSVTKTYPVYAVALRVGSYTLPTVKTEISNKLQTVKRNDEVKSYHYFDVNLDLDTDVATFTSLALTQLGIDPIRPSASTGILAVTTPTPHKLKTGDTVFVLGAKTFAGIPTNTVNGKFSMVEIGSNEFTYEINVNAINSVQGGGNTVKIGIPSSFQLLFGEYSDTVASNLGFPLENSSERIDTSIVSINRKYQAKLTTVSPHGMSKTYDYIGKPINLLDSKTAPDIDGTLVITNVLDDYNILVGLSTPLQSNNVNKRIVSIENVAGQVVVTTAVPHELGFLDDITIFSSNSAPSLNGRFTVQQVIDSTKIGLNSDVDFTKNGTNGYLSIGTFTFNGTAFPISSISGVDEQIEIVTATPHNYKLSDVGTTTLTVFDSLCQPAIDGEQQIANVPSDTTILLSGSILSGVSATLSKPRVGSTPRHIPLRTFTFKIEGVQILGRTTRFTSTGHTLRPGDTITFYDLTTIPIINSKSFAIANVPSPDTFEVNYEITYFNQDDILQGRAYIGTGLVEVSFPGHGFNQIRQLVDTGTSIEVTTVLPHGLATGSKKRINSTNTSIDGFYEMTRVDDYSFEFEHPANYVPASPGTVIGTSGILGMSNEFYLYGAPRTGGIPEEQINAVKHTVREVIDQNTFTLYINGATSATVEQGGGSSLFISSLLHGFNGTQTNTKNGVLYRSISLEGENYCFLTCPLLGTIVNTGNVKDIFARISLSESPGAVIFNAYNSNPKFFEESPYPKIEELEFSVKNYNDTLYEFNDLDYSFALEIVEYVDVIENTNVSSRRGVSDHS